MENSLPTTPKHTYRKVRILSLIVLTAMGIMAFNIISQHKDIKRQVDISIMEEEKPKKLISLNTYISTDANFENAYILGDKGNLYVLCCDSENYYAELWHPEFWKGIKVVDLCAGDKTDSYAMALDEKGSVYIWGKECLSKGSELEKRNDWQIQRMENIPEVAQIFSGYDQFVLVTKEGTVYSFHPKDSGNPGMDNMEMIDVKSPVLGMASLKEELLILDCDHVLWSIENGTKKIVKENVKTIVQGGKGFVVQMMDDGNTVYVYNIYLLQKGYETVTFADKYEVSKVTFESEISFLAVSSKTAVVCVGEENFYRWGRKQRVNLVTKLGCFVTLSDKVYDQPIEVDIKGAQYYMLIGKDIVYVDEQKRMFALIQHF